MNKYITHLGSKSKECPRSHVNLIFRRAEGEGDKHVI